MNRYMFIYSFVSFLSAISLPDDIKMKIGVGYNSNFLKLSEYESQNVLNSHLILGDSNTSDSPLLNGSFQFVEEFRIIPFFLNVDMRFSNFTQSLNKVSYSTNINISHRFGNYRWIKFGYKNNPKIYLRMYKDKDRIGSPLDVVDFKYEKFFSSISFPIYKKIWIRGQLGMATNYFNENFTEFDLKQNEFFIKMFNLSFSELVFSPSFKFIISENITFNDGLISNNLDRSYEEYVFGNDLTIFQKNRFFDHIKSSIGFKLRNYTSKDLLDVLHSNRSHKEYSIITKMSKNINEKIVVSYYCKYLNRKTNGSNSYIENLKSFNSFEFGFDFLINLTDELYDISY